MRRMQQLTVGVISALFVLAGCSTGAVDVGDDSAVHPAQGPREAADTEAQDGVVDDGRAESGTGPALEYSGTSEHREVITTAEVAMLVPDPAESADEVAQLAEAADGRVDQRSVRAARATGENTDRNTSERPAGAWLTVRVPAAELEAFLERLQDLGEVHEVNQSGEDVTQVAQDLDARIGALETSTERLLEIMAQATDSADLIAAEEALSQRQAELESLQSQRASISDRVAMSTVHVNLRAEHAPTLERDGFIGGLQTGWHGLISVVSGLLVLAGMIVPWLPVVVVPVLVLLWAVRRRRRRRSGNSTPEVATPAPAPGAPEGTRGAE